MFWIGLIIGFCLGLPIILVWGDEDDKIIQFGRFRITKINREAER